MKHHIMNDPSISYVINVERNGDQEPYEYIGNCRGFPSLSWVDSSHSRAFYGITKLISLYLKDVENEND